MALPIQFIQSSGGTSLNTSIYGGPGDFLLRNYNQGSSSFSVACYFNTKFLNLNISNNNGAWFGISTQQSSGVDGQWAFRYNRSTSKFEWAVRTRNGGSINTVVLATSATYSRVGDENFMMLATYDNVSKQSRLKIYKFSTGILTNQLVTTSWNIDPMTGVPTYLNVFNGAAAGCKTGSMSCIGVWNKVLTFSEESELYNSGFGAQYSDLTVGIKTGLISWWDSNLIETIPSGFGTGIKSKVNTNEWLYAVCGSIILANTSFPTIQPAILTSVSGITSNQVKLDWTNGTTTAVRTGNSIWRKTLPAGLDTNVATVASGATTATITETITADNEYYVKAVYGVQSADSNKITLPFYNVSLTAIPSADQQITVNWTNTSANNTNIVMYRSTDNITYNVLATLAANTTSYINNGLSVSTVYFYKFKYRNVSGAATATSFLTTAVSARTTFDAPVFLSLIQSPIGSTTNLLTWTNNSAGETNFEIYRKLTTGSSFSLLATTAANVTGYTDSSGLVLGKTYSYYIRAINTANTFTSLPSQTLAVFMDVANSAFNICSGANERIHQIIKNPTDAGIFIGGRFTSFKSSSLKGFQKLFPNGIIDTTFNQGTGFANTFGQVIIFAIAVDLNGKIYVGGTFTSYNGTAANNIIRLNQDGSIDTAFVYGSGVDISVFAIQVDADNKVYITGGFSTYNGNSARGIIRLFENGSVDTIFNVGSGFDGDLSGRKFYLDNVNNRLYVVGDFNTYKGVNAQSIVCLNFDGSINGTFNSGTGFQGFANIANDIIADANGKLYVAHGCTEYNGVSSNGIIRLNTNGTIDTAFNYGTGFNTDVNVLALDNNGKLYVGYDGTSYTGATNNFIIRLNPNGSKDTTFVNTTGFNAFVDAILVKPNNSILVGGNFTTWKGVRFNRLVAITSGGTEITSTLCPTVIDADFSDICQTTINFTPISATTGYRIYRSIDNITYSLIATLTGSSHSTYVDTTAAPSILTYYRVDTYDADFTLESNIDSGTRTFVSPTTNTITGTECTLNNLLSWTNPSTCNTGVRIFRSLDNVTFTQIASLGASVQSYNDFGLTFNVPNYYKIATDFSQFSVAYTGATSSKTTLFSAPSGVTVINQNSYSLDISWSLNTTCESQVLLERRIGTGGTWTQITSLANGVELFSDYSLVNNVQYFYRVRVLSPNGQYSPYSSEVSFTYSAFFINNGFNNIVKTISFDTINQPTIGGSFTTYYNGTSANRIAGLRQIGTFNTTFNYGSGFNNEVTEVVFDPSISMFYVGGTFTTYKGVSCPKLVRIDLNGDIDNTFNSGLASVTTINKIVLASGGKIYVGGTFTNNIARLNSDGTIDGAFAASLNSTVQDLVLDGSGNVYVGGSFTNRVVKLFASNGTTDTSFNVGTGFNSTVYALAIDPVAGGIYIGGDFTSYSGSPNRVRYIRLNTNGTIDSSFVVNSNGANGIVRKISVFPADNDVFIGGDFTLISLSPYNRMVKLRRTDGGISFANFDYSLYTGFNGAVWDIQFDSLNNIFVGGAFTTYNGATYNRLLKLSPFGRIVTYSTLAVNETFLTFVSATTTNQVNLVWNTVGISPLASNLIYRRKVNSGSYVLMATVSSGATTTTITETINDDYEYYVEAVRVVSGSSISNFVTLPYNTTAPSTSRNTANQLNLAWTNTSPFATTVEIWRAIGAGSYSLFTSIPIGTTYNNISLIEDTVYSYKFKYNNGTQAKSWFGSSTSGLTYLNTPVLNDVIQPTNGVKTLDLYWSDNSSVETGYEIYRRVAGVGSFVLIHTTAANAVFYSDTSLPAFGDYEYYIRAVKGSSNISLDSNIISARVELTTIVLDYDIIQDSNLITKDVYLFWSISGNCTGNTYSVYRSSDGVTFGLIATTTSLFYTDNNIFGECDNCKSFYYKVEILCNSLVISNTVLVNNEQAKSDWNLGGISNIWIAGRSSTLSYTVVDATFKTLEFYGNNIATIKDFNEALTWYELPTGVDTKYEQKMKIDNRGYSFAETLDLTIPKLNPNKWAQIQSLIGDQYVIIFKTNNGEYCVTGYENPAKIEVFEASTDDSLYKLSIQLNGNYNLVKFISETYINTFIL